MRQTYVIVLAFLVVSIAVSQDTKENADYKLALNLYNDKLYDLALEQFRQFVSMYPNTQNGTEARFYLGLTQSKLGKHEDARVSFQNFALTYQENSRAPEAWWNVAEACVALKNFREAALAYERVKTFHPKSKLAPAALQKAAEYFELVNERDNTKKILRTLTQEYGSADILPARLKLAEFLTEESQHDAARLECKTVADATKDNNLKARALLMMSSSLASLNRIPEAESALNQVITNLRTTSSYHAALLSLGRLRRSNGNLSEASAAWKTVADDSLRAPLQPRQDALIELGDASSASRDNVKGLSYFQRAASIQATRRSEAYYKAGVSAERLNRGVLAGDMYSRVLTDTASGFDQRALLIGAFKGAKLTKNFIEAERIGRLYGARFPSDHRTPRMLVETAEILHKELNDPRAAVAMYETLIAQFPKSPLVDDASFGLGKSLRMAGDFEHAAEQMEVLQKKYPVSEFAGPARDESESIRIFDIKDREAGQEKLAVLIGDVIEQKSKGDLAFRLAEIYFHDLKDYAKASVQYELALKFDLDPAKRPAAWFYQAKSLEYGSRRQLSGSSQQSLRAIASYDSLLKTFPVSEFTDEAQLSQFRLKLQVASNSSEARRIGTEFLSSFPNARRSDVALLALASAYQSAKNYEDAALAYRMVLERNSKSDLVPEAQFQLGATLFTMGETDSSAKILNQFILAYVNHPRSSQAAFMLAALASRKGRAAEAVGWYDRIEKMYFYARENQELDRLRGEAFFNGGEFARSVESYQKYLSSMSQDFFNVGEISSDVFYKLAVASDKLGNRSAARQHYLEFLLREPTSSLAGSVYYSLSGIARSENKLDLAGKYLQEASRLGGAGQEDQVTLETAELLFKNEQYGEAITRFSEVAGKTKTDSLRMYVQSRIIVGYMRLDNFKEADRRIPGFVKSYPTAFASVAEFEFERGRYHMRKDEVEKARQRFDLVRNRYPKTPVVPEAMYWSARLLELQEQPQQAIQVYDSILRVYPQSSIAPRTQLSLGNVYYTLEQWDAASKLYKVLLDNPARSPDLLQYAMNNQILSYKELNLFDAALDLTRKYITAYPDDPDIIDKKIDIGVLYQKLGYYDQSVTHLQKLMETSGGEIEAEIRYYIGEAFFYKGDLQQAILEFLKVPYLVGRRGKIDWTATSYYMAGQSYEKMAKYEQAVTMYRQIIERPGIDVAFKTAAQKEIDRVKTIERRN